MSGDVAKPRQLNEGLIPPTSPPIRIFEELTDCDLGCERQPQCKGGGSHDRSIGAFAQRLKKLKPPMPWGVGLWGGETQAVEGLPFAIGESFSGKSSGLDGLVQGAGMDLGCGHAEPHE